MPTPSDNTPQLSTASIIVDDISVHTTCPPEVDRLSIWRGDSPETSSSAERNGVENVSAPAASATPQSVLMRSDDETGHAHASTPNVEDPMKIETGAPGAGTSSLRRSTTKSDEDSPVVGRLSPAGEPSRSSGQPSSVTSSPSTSALLGYEFSNVRVRLRVRMRDSFQKLTVGSFFQIILPLSYAPGVNSAGPSNRTVRCIMSMSRSSMSIWLNHVFVATFAFKVNLPTIRSHDLV